MMRVQMIKSIAIPVPGDGLQLFQGGRFYIVEDDQALGWIDLGCAIDPDAPAPTPIAEPLQPPPEVDEAVITEPAVAVPDEQKDGEA